MLQEILTIKSDECPPFQSVRVHYQGEPIRKVNIPESFNVLIPRAEGLGLDVELLKNNKKIELSGEKSGKAGSALPEKELTNSLCFQDRNAQNDDFDAIRLRLASRR